MSKDNAKEPKMAPQKKVCGIIMPIAPHPDYHGDHWSDVLTILTEAISQTEFEPRLVSDDVAIGLIHERIVTNIYNNEVVVCDVSSRNPNVMFELGLRLAFDKPTIIIKDEKTNYSFDTGIIEHVNYPSSLRFAQMVKFKEELVKRINATYKRSVSEPNYSPFLKSFGKTINPSSIQQSEIPEGRYILDQLERVNKELQIMRFQQRNSSSYDHKKGIYYSISDKERRSLINTVVLHKLKNDSLEKVADDSFYTSLVNDLAINGINISIDELKDYIAGNFKMII
ncbi:MAG: hypothetical protein QM731_08240 [Chitinophagaceae bacterium]